jgi:hypothetical protein
MTNPNNAVGTNAAYDGRTSVNAFNDGLAAYTSGIMSGWGCVPDSGMTVSLGGDGNTRDVAVAEDNAGNKTTINNISGSPINVTLGAAPGSNSRIDVIVAYVDNPPQGSSSVADNPAACGIIAVQGTPANTPVVPNDGTIRTAITADGASGTTAYYVILAQITVTSGTTDITSQNIAAGANASIGTEQINDGAVTSDKIDFTTIRSVLYTASSSTTTVNSITLSESVADYDALEIYYNQKDFKNDVSSMKIISEYFSQFNLPLVRADGNNVGWYAVRCSVSNTALSISVGGGVSASGMSIAGYTNERQIVIRKVIGIKYH